MGERQNATIAYDFTTHKAQPWEEALSQGQQGKTIIRPWEEALSQSSPVTVALVILVTTPLLGVTDMKSQPTAILLKWLINKPIWVDHGHFQDKNYNRLIFWYNK
jgi:hypothetical protein